MKYSLGAVRHQLQRLIKGGSNRDSFSKVVCLFLPNKNTQLNNEDASDFMQIENKGFLSLPNFLEPVVVSKIMAQLEGKKVYDRYDKKKTLFDPASPLENARTGAFLEKDIVNIEEIINIANNKKILRLVSEYLGCKPTLSNITMWYSYPNKEGGAINSENYHRDVDDFKFIKFFIYLTDVTHNDGPHVFVDGSHKGNEFSEIRRFTDEEIEAYYKKDRIRYVTGKKGDAFVECTYGIHKGLVPKNAGRLVLQFEYSMLSIGAYQYKEKFVPVNRDIYDSYINRLYI